MTTQEHTELALKAIDGDDAARCYLAGYDVARSDIARRGHPHARRVLQDSRHRGANARWVAGYSRAVYAMTPTTPYTADLDDLTVLVTDKNGEIRDLNAEGLPCKTLGELRLFIHELRERGYFGRRMRDHLLAETHDQTTA